MHTYLKYAFLTKLSEDPNNTIIGLVRNKATTIQKISEDAVMKGRSNYRIVEGDLAIYESIKVRFLQPLQLGHGVNRPQQRTAAEVSQLTDGAIDYLILNASYISLFDNFDPLGYL
jgi:hypothetical protein